MELAKITFAMPCDGKDKISKEEFIDWLTSEDSSSVFWERHSPIKDSEGNIIGYSKQSNAYKI